MVDWPEEIRGFIAKNLKNSKVYFKPQKIMPPLRFIGSMKLIFAEDLFVRLKYTF